MLGSVVYWSTRDENALFWSSIFISFALFLAVTLCLTYLLTD